MMKTDVNLSLGPKKMCLEKYYDTKKVDAEKLLTL